MPKKYDLSNLSVLVVDDNTYMISIIKTLLRAFGINKIRDANDAALALEELTNTQVDIIILDCAMPTFDGIEFTRMVRTATDSSNPYVPIIMLTAYTERFRIEEARDAGVTEILRKPISAFDLYLRLIEVIERPRSFVKTNSFFGPDRRRRPNETYAGAKRRAIDKDGNEIEDDEEAAAGEQPAAESTAGGKPAEAAQPAAGKPAPSPAKPASGPAKQPAEAKQGAGALEQA